MAFSSDVDPATAALIARLMAEDLGEAYESHFHPIGASWHDYEEPLSSYERQCLDAENGSDGQGDERSGWGPGDSGEINRAVAPDQSFSSTESAGDGTWNSSFMNGDSRVQQSTTSDHASQVALTDEEGNHFEPKPRSIPTSEGPADSPARIEPVPTGEVPTKQAREERNVLDPVVIPIRTISVAWPEPVKVPQEHIDPSDDSARCKPVVPPNPVAPNKEPSVSTTRDVEDKWDDGLDYSSHKGKGKAVRAYDEFKLGLRNGEMQNRARYHRKEEDSEDDDDSEDENEDGNEVDDEDLLFIRVPWPRVEEDELLSRREDSSVVEIRVEDDETLESILRDIDLKAKLKGIGGVGDEVPKEIHGASLW